MNCNDNGDDHAFSPMIFAGAIVGVCDECGVEAPSWYTDVWRSYERAVAAGKDDAPTASVSARNEVGRRVQRLLGMMPATNPVDRRSAPLARAVAVTEDSRRRHPVRWPEFEE